MLHYYYYSIIYIIIIIIIIIKKCTTMYHHCEPWDNARPAFATHVHVRIDGQHRKGKQGTSNFKNNLIHFRCIKYLAV